MAQHRRNRIGFWVFLLLVALGFGWVANQEGRWPFLGLFAPPGGQQEAEAILEPVAEPQLAPPAPDAVAKQPADQQAEREHAQDAPPDDQGPATELSAAVRSEAQSAPPAAPAVPGEDAASLADRQAGAPDPTATSDLTGTTAAEDLNGPDDLSGATGIDDPASLAGTAEAERPTATHTPTMAMGIDDPNDLAGTAEAENPTATDAAAGTAGTNNPNVLAGTTGAESPTGTEDLAEASGTEDPTIASAPPQTATAESPAATDATTPPGEQRAAGTDVALATPTQTDPVPAAGSGTDPGMIPPIPSDRQREQARDVPAGPSGAPAPAQAMARVSDNPLAVAGTEPGSTLQQPAGSGTDVAAIAPPDGQAPAQVTDAAGSSGNDPEQEVAALLSDAKAADPPSFDIVRVEPDGRAVIAGRAAPGAEVELRSGEDVIDRVRASQRGDWVAIPGKPLSPGDQELTVVAALKGEVVESEQVVVVAVPARAAVPNQASAAIPLPMAVLLPRTGRGTGRILQAPGRLSAEGTLALMTVGYNQQGRMLLSGEAPPGVPVRVYVDNQPMALVVGDAKGAWSSGLDQALAPGTYTLRLDQLDAKGRTVARIETPITRVSEPPIEGELQVDYVVVQPGNSLWRIARRLTGKGVDYVYIYDSNQAQIRDPDLIFPGQVFQIPPQVGTAGAS